MALFGTFLANAWTRVFHDRQIVLCSDSGARRLCFRKRHQILAAAMVGGLVLWSGAASLGAAATASWVLTERSAELRALEDRYGVLAEDMARRIGWGAGISDSLDAERPVNHRIVAQNARLIADVTALQTALRQAEAAHAEAAGGVRALTAALAHRDRRLSAAAAREDALERQVAARDADIAGWRTAERAWAAERTRLEAGLADRDEALAAARAQSAALEARLGQTTRSAAVLWQHRNALVDDRARMGAGLDAGGQALLVATHRIGELETELRGAYARAGELWAAVQRERDRSGALAGERDRARLQLAAFEEAQEELIGGLRARIEEHVGEVEAGLAFTGLDVDALLASIDTGGESAYGGPMIPVLPEDVPDEGLWAEAVEVVAGADRAAGLRDVANALPIGHPVRDEHRLSSNFGYRRDPFTGRSSRHAGLDLAAPTGTPIYATAPGTVTDAGWSGAYGNMVEVTHEFGLATRYAHLSAISVAVGQEIAYGEQVGLMGSTGRSSGPHLHYEVRVNDEPRNPIDFIRAGQHVLQAAN